MEILPINRTPHSIPFLSMLINSGNLLMSNPYDPNLRLIIHEHILVGYLVLGKYENISVIDIIEIFPMFRGKGLAKQAVLLQDAIPSNILSFPHWINIMGIRYWRDMLAKHGPTKLANIIIGDDNNKYITNFIKRLVVDDDANYDKWDEYESLLSHDLTVKFSKPMLSKFYTEYYIIDDKHVVIGYMKYNCTSRPLTDRDIRIITLHGYTYVDYVPCNLLFKDGYENSVDLLRKLDISTRYISNTTIYPTMKCSHNNTLYWDRLY